MYKTKIKPTESLSPLTESARNPAKSAAIIRNAASYVMSLAHHVLRIVPGLVHTADGARYHVQCPVICYHA
jgi:hypothetical protein